MKTVAVVQARMNSTRLPGKVLKKLVGKPMVWHIINRLGFAKSIDETILAIPAGDQPLEDFAREYGFNYYAGSEDDLLDRCYQAARQCRADAAVRITADCPLVDPEVIDRLMRFFTEEGPFDFAGNSRPKASWPHGLDAEVYDMEAMGKVWQEEKDPFKREWLNTNFLLHPDKYKIGNLVNEEDLSSYRWTVDYEEDFIFMTEVFQRLYREGEVFLMQETVRLLQQHPELTGINSKYARDEAFKQALEEEGIDAKSIFPG